MDEFEDDINKLADETGLYIYAMKKYGMDMQLNILAEECSEVIKEVMKMKRGRENKYDLIEEIADVEIMIGQFRTRWGLKIDAIKREKLERLKDRLYES